MAEVKRLQDLIHVVSDVKVCEALVQLSEVGLTRVHEFSDNGWCLGERISDDIDQVDNVGASLKGLQDLDLSPNFVLLH